MRNTRKIDLKLDMRVLHSFLWTKNPIEWTTSLNITDWTGLSGLTIRKVCQEYPRLFVSSTSGYKLTGYATNAEIQHCVATLLSRSSKMITRASALSGRLS